MTISPSKDVIKYIDATAGLHHGHDSKEFVELLGKLKQPQAGFIKVTKTSIADYFGITRQNLDNWIRHYNDQYGKDNDRSAV